MYIYRITNTTNGKCYIGQSKQTNNRRLNNHRYLLKANRHSNTHLQSAWNFYGESAFLFEKIAYANSIEELDELEKCIISEHNSDDREYGYNIFAGGHHLHSVPSETRKKISIANTGNTHTEDQKTKWSREKRVNSYADKILSPCGTIYEVNNLRKFCKLHGLDRSNLMKVLTGKAYHVKGWRLLTTPKEFCDNGYVTYYKQSTFRGKKLLGPDNQVYVIDKPLATFCKQHNIRPNKIRLVLLGKQKIHLGWKTYTEN